MSDVTSARTCNHIVRKQIHLCNLTAGSDDVKNFGQIGKTSENARRLLAPYVELQSTQKGVLTSDGNRQFSFFHVAKMTAVEHCCNVPECNGFLSHYVWFSRSLEKSHKNSALVSCLLCSHNSGLSCMLLCVRCAVQVILESLHGCQQLLAPCKTTKPLFWRLVKFCSASYFHTIRRVWCGFASQSLSHCDQ